MGRLSLVEEGEYRERVEKAIAIAHRNAGEDGDHHKMWCIDQMVRALTGCPTITLSKLNHKGRKYEYETQGSSDEYKQFVADYEECDVCYGEVTEGYTCGNCEGEQCYEWDTGNCNKVVPYMGRKND